MIHFLFLVLSMLVVEPSFAKDLLLEQRYLSSTSVPQGAQRVGMLQLTIQNSCDHSVDVQEVVVKHAGLGASADIEHVYLMDGVRRISSSQSFSNRNRTTVVRPRGLHIDACAKKIVEIRADFSADAAAGGEHRLIVTAIKLSDGLVVQGNLSSSSTARTVPQNAGIISVEYLPLLETVRFGASKTVTRFKLTADNQQDHMISAITFTNDGSAKDADLQNLKLMDGTKVLSQIESQLDGSKVRFTLTSPLSLNKNSTKLFTIKADVRASARRTINLMIEEPSDLEATASSR